MDLHLRPQGSLKIRPQMSFSLRQAIEVLGMPQLELALWIRQEIEKNPLLEEILPLKKNSFQEDIPFEKSLYDHILGQIQESELNDKEKKQALLFYEFLDEKGFLSTDIEEIVKKGELSLQEGEKILSVLQTFDPPGIFAKNLQESLLLQLKALGEGRSSSYKLVKDYFEDLLQGRFKRIEKTIGEEELKEAIQKLSRLFLRPARAFQKEPSLLATPDLKIFYVDEKWVVEVSEEDLPKIEIRTDYLDLPLASKEESRSIQEWKASAKWLFRSLRKRRQILLALGILLVKKQAGYFSQKGPLAKVTLQEAASLLEIHESTLSRAIYGKYILTPRGSAPIRSLFTAPLTVEGAKEALLEIIEKEDKTSPLTDEELVSSLRERGIYLARRTVAKYRKKLQISSAPIRKRFR